MKAQQYRNLHQMFLDTVGKDKMKTFRVKIQDTPVQRSISRYLRTVERAQKATKNSNLQFD